ncbi:hypothetical protein BJ085DRAFT_36227 [Dimargaris cristalligena]|uniref:50S ribosomal protein L35 n=1 Tax=Dimargaris cristalligena TaxID=215637 RepID=A0A4P9ZWA2_9FUNG|nr:hypothetical protein BJ085DRAFT_36227 [Dimargaris cristalligena]|eukprot:RKP37897.1 hypothetical protein BJ085DRAFT_36227 [Dimargaris cristalligena]
MSGWMSATRADSNPRNPLIQASGFFRNTSSNFLGLGSVLTTVRTKYKMKTHSGTKKRFRLNAHGEFRVTHASRGHFNRKVRGMRRRASRHPLVLASAYHNHMKKLMPYA